MKKITGLIVLTIISISIFVLGFDYRNSQEPNTYYRVYLSDQLIGTVLSKAELENYINKQGNYYKNKYNVAEVYAPNGLMFEKVTTFIKDIDTAKEVYNIIESKEPFTIKGYQFTLNDGKTTKKIYVTEESVFKDAISDTINTFVGTAEYQSYLDNTQAEIKTTGVVIQDIYVDEEITSKETKISVDNTIYNDSKTLAKYLLFGTTDAQKIYTVKNGDTIESISFNNKISVEEFLISNNQFTNSKSLLFNGQQVTIGITDPQVKVVTEEYVVADITNKYSTEYIVDSTLYVGSERLVRNGSDGLIRVAQHRTLVNGDILIVGEPESKTEIKAAISRIVRIGNKKLPSNVGNVKYWRWPTNAGWVITSNYSWRINPITHARQFHDGIDIAGVGYRSRIYAANNGTVSQTGYNFYGGNFVIINHNNGYYSYYAHLDSYVVSPGETVAAGDVIGYMGSSGQVTGIHLHFAIYNSIPFMGTYALNPWDFY